MNKRLAILLSILAVCVVLLLISNKEKSYTSKFLTNPFKDFKSRINQPNKITTGKQHKSGAEIYHNGEVTRVEPASKPTPQATSQQRQKHNKIGEKFEIDGLTYKVVSATNAGKEVGFSRTTGSYIKVIIEIENTGKITSGFHTVRIIDSEGRQFQPGILFNFMSNSNHESYSTFSTLKAGFTSKRQATFEVSDKSSGLKLVFANNEGRITNIIPLGI